MAITPTSTELSEGPTARDQGIASAGDGRATCKTLAKRHLWMHFTRMGVYADSDVPVIVRGDGCYVYDEHGKRYLDGLSALYCVNIGHGRAELGQAAARQAEELGFYTNWSYAHPRSIELAARIAALAPGNLNRVFFTSGGSEAVESAWKLAKAYHAAKGEPTRTKLISRQLAYHGTSMGALTATGVPALRTPFEPLTPGGHHVPNTNSYRWSEDRDPLWAADAIEEAILFEGPATVAAVILEPVQNSGGCFVPQEGYFQRVREICDRHGVLLISDEVICAWGRLGYWFGCERFDYQPDMITMAKGLTSAYAPLGAVLACRSHRRAVPARDRDLHPRLHLRRAPDGVRGGAGEHRRDGARGSVRARARERGPLPGDARGAARPADRRRRARRRLLPRDRAGEGQGRRSRRSTTRSQSSCCAASSPASCYSRGLICRTDDRGDPVVQLSPPLIAGEEQFAEIESILRPVLSEAGERIGRWS